MNKEKVLVAMSGGVDSSVAALLLKEQGYQVLGVTMLLRKNVDESVKDAKRVCSRLGVEHKVLDFSKQFETRVVNNFISEYFKGRTPNPCIECNRYIKFGILLEEAFSSGFDYLATGHYASIENHNGDYFLKRPKDRTKDQTYFLYAIKYKYLEKILFPLGEYLKTEVIEIAKRKNLPLTNKPQSQDICFIPNGDYRNFINRGIADIEPGPILDLDGNLLGHHKGVFFYTVGQRGGLGISSAAPLYVISIHPEKNQIVVGEKKDLGSKSLIVSKLNFLVKDLAQDVFAKIRYTHKEAGCIIKRLNAEVKVVFNQVQTAITPGQSVVFYKDDIVLAGGIIKEVIR